VSLLSNALEGSDGYSVGYFLRMKWNTPSESSETALLTRLLLVDETCELAKKFIEQINIQEVLQTQLDVHEVGVQDLTGELIPYKFRGSIIELFAQLNGQFPKQFRFLLELRIDHFDPSILLLSVLVSHCQEHQRCNEDYCILSKLLQLGANANDSRHKVTPLQIAVERNDFDGVKVLLEAGADPNGTGDSGGIKWERGTYLSFFNELHNLSPLEVYKNYVTYTSIGRNQMPGGMIDTILLQYGATPCPETTRWTRTKAEDMGRPYKLDLVASGFTVNSKAYHKSSPEKPVQILELH
jgi:hypothetical protein